MDTGATTTIVFELVSDEEDGKDGENRCVGHGSDFGLFITMEAMEAMASTSASAASLYKKKKRKKRKKQRNQTKRKHGGCWQAVLVALVLVLVAWWQSTYLVMLARN
ncbi:hypothetical protein OAM67_01485 [bacterium]|nr:hypothetical protein [bacterium]